MKRISALALVLSCLIFLGTRAHAAATQAEEEHEHAHEHAHGDDHDEIENIIVTATPLPHQKDELATPVIRMNHDSIVKRLGTTLGETVGELPGVTTSGFTAGASRPVIRGQDAFRTKVLEDGLSTQDVSQLSPDHAVPVNPIIAQAIEVVRGPGVLRYGGGASAGVVNVITQRIPDEAIIPPVEIDLLGAYQSNGEGGDFGGVARGGFGNFAWHVDGLYRKTDDYETGAGDTQIGTFAETWGAAMGAAYMFEKGRLGFSYNRYDSNYGIPEEEPVEIDMRTNRYRFEGEWEEPLRGIREINLRGVYSDYIHDEIADGEIGQTYKNDEFDGRLEMLHAEWLGFVGAVGFQGTHQKFEGGGEAAEFLAPSESYSFAAYFFEELPLGEAFDVQAGLRIEGAWVEGTPISDDFTKRSFVPVSGSLALLYHPTGTVTAGLTATAGQRAPSQVELFARGPHEATATFEIGNPDFNEETSYTADLRIAGDFGRVGFEASAFTTFYGNFIYGDLPGITVGEDGDPAGDELDLLIYSARNTIFFGTELTMNVDIIEFLGGTIGTDWQLDYVRAQFTEGDGDRNVPRITPLRWGIALTYEHESLSGSFGFLRNEEQWDPAAGEFATDDFTMLNLTASYAFGLFDDRLGMHLDFVARNLLDEEARNAVSITKEEVLLPGRNFRVSLRVDF